MERKGRMGSMGYRKDDSGKWAKVKKVWKSELVKFMDDWSRYV